MRLRTEFIQLPLTFDAALLAAEAARFEPGDWRPHPQGHPGNFALPLIAAGGDPTNDATRGAMRPTPHLARCPYLAQAIAALGTVCGRTRLMRLEGHAEATPHTDTNYYWIDRMRVHIPVQTSPEVRFQCGERDVHMAAGEAWIFDTWRRHNVTNPRDASRIHLVVDTVGSLLLWDLLQGARDPFGAAAAGWTPRAIRFDPDARVALELESHNHPVVMSPGELAQLADLVLGELYPDGADAGAITALDHAVARLRFGWRALWARYAAEPAGWSAYAALLAECDARIAPYARRARLPNGVDAVEALRQFIVRSALNPELAPSTPELTAPRAPATRDTQRECDPCAEPIFIVCPPRSGSSLLFETLARAPGLATIGGESHRLIEGIAALDPAQRGFDSNRLVQRDATPEVTLALAQRFRANLRDRDGRAPSASDRPLRLLEKTPKNALRVPFLAAAFPNARFVYLYRDARETLSSMLDAWKSGRFVTYPQLPGWPGMPWSLLLTPGWREWGDLPAAEIVARQWNAATRILLDDLEALEPERWCVASYDRLIESPQEEIERLCGFLGLEWDVPLTAPLPNSRHTLTSPEPDKWKHNAAELDPVMHIVAAQAQRAHQVFGRPPAARPRHKRPAVQKAAAAGFTSVHTTTMPELLATLDGTLAVSTYQSGRLILVRNDAGSINTHFRAFPSPMGIARQGAQIALGTQRVVWRFANQPGAAAALEPKGRHDACFVPMSAQLTGDIRIHEMAFAGDALWVVNTRFSCLALLDDRHSFVPQWRPRFVSALAAQDRCHLNGLAIVDGTPAFVTALGATDTPAGWRENKANGGCLIDVASNEIVAGGLCMPHSPRRYAGRLWLLESGTGTLATVDLASGRTEPVAVLPGFARGLAFAGRYAFVGLSQVRESVFDGVPVASRETARHCGVWVVDIRSGAIVAFLRFEGDVREIFDVQFLAGLRYPELLEPEHERTAGAFLLPDAALAETVAEA